MEILGTDESHFIPFISDYGFKATFGNENQTLFLRQALQALIGLATPIEEVELLPAEQLGISPDSRGGVYDLSCKASDGTHFIVEMQLGRYANFIQRMKFYTLYRFNTLLKKGDYQFENLPRIYCIGILAFTLFPSLQGFHNVITLRNQDGELIDDQTTYITVELDKFHAPLEHLETDLDKLIYTMKTLHTAPKDPIQWPKIWNEEWLKLAIEELDKRSMNAEQRLAYEMTLMTNAAVVHGEKKLVEETKAEMIREGLKEGLSLETLAKISGMPVEFVVKVKESLES